MSVWFLCKLISLNIWVAKLKRRLFYIFVLTLTQTYEENLCFTRLNNFANNSKKPQELSRFLSVCLFFYTICQFLLNDYYFLRTENFTNTCQRARFCVHRHDWGNRGYYMAAQGYEFYLRVLKVSLTSERSAPVRDTFSMRR